MAHQHAAFQMDDTALSRIWAAQGLGSIHSTDWAGKGVNNPSFVINGTHVIRFDGLVNQGLSRFHGEQIAYDYLRKADILCPQIITVDDSKALVPYDYMIMTKMEGVPLDESWSQLTSIQQQDIATEAGQILARIHMIRLPQFGRLYGTKGVFDNWYAYIRDTFQDMGQESLANEMISAALHDRMQSILVAHRRTFESIRAPSLVHWDYHFGNLLQVDGKITAVLDLEWALGGDPAHDFNRRSEWEDQCPGSLNWVYEGYTSLLPLQPSHETRVALYEMLWFLHCVMDAPHAAEANMMLMKLVDRLDWLEENR
ncbi:MAG: aminoglycoside phosphotransferase family protein [Anaerolineae bacterium]|nr:aminoglycoside phosphotransferase family protein [Anaerolineae bacterium]